jgi:hypothetical protein
VGHGSMSRAPSLRRSSTDRRTASRDKESGPAKDSRGSKPYPRVGTRPEKAASLSAGPVGWRKAEVAATGRLAYLMTGPSSFSAVMPALAYGDLQHAAK